MNAVLLALIIVTMSLNSVFCKEYGRKAGNKGTFLFSSMSCAAGCLYFLVSSGGRLGFDISLLPYVLGFAFSNASAVLCSYMAISSGPIALTALITSYSLIIPTLFGIICYKEKLSGFFLIGILFMTVSLFLINFAKAERKPTLRWAFYVFCTFLFNGACATVQTLQQRSFGGAYKNELMIVSYALAAAVFLLAALSKERGELKLCAHKGMGLAFLRGINNGFMNYLVMVMALRAAVSLMFPILSVGGVLLSAAIAVVLYKERLSFMQSIGVIFGLGAIIFLNL